MDSRAQEDRVERNDIWEEFTPHSTQPSSLSMKYPQLPPALSFLPSSPLPSPPPSPPDDDAPPEAPVQRRPVHDDGVLDVVPAVAHHRHRGVLPGAQAVKTNLGGGEGRKGGGRGTGGGRGEERE